MRPLVVGGNSGVGLAIVCEFIKHGAKKIYIVGKDCPNINLLEDDVKSVFWDIVVFKKCNFVTFDISIFNEIDDIDCLIITAGFGRVSLLQNLSEREVKNLLTVNLDANIQIIKHYYNKIISDIDFYTAVMVSICGRIVSPYFSVYGAAKAGLRFFIENINCELCSQGLNNRILDVSPGSIKGTAFNGGSNDISSLSDLSNTIIQKMINRDMLYIPQFDNVYKDVINRYESNSIQFGLDSFKYKTESGRISNNEQCVVGYLSGTFDLFHIGHLNLLKRAKEMCDYLIVSVHNNGLWKGKETFIPYDERKEIVKSIKYVDEVVDDYLEDYDAWEKYHYNKLFVGSDYKGTERFNRYEQLLIDKAEIVYFPYTNGTSSTQLREALKRKN